MAARDIPLRYRLLAAGVLVGLAVYVVAIACDAMLGPSSVEIAGRQAKPIDLLMFGALGLAAGCAMALCVSWVVDRTASKGGAWRLLRTAVVPVALAVAVGAIWGAANLDSSEASNRPQPVVTFEDPHFHSDSAAASLPASDSHEHPPAANSDTTPMGEGNAHTHGTETPVTPQQLVAAAAFVAQVKESTQQYADVRAAMANGYVQITQDLPGIAAHFIRADYVADSAVMDPQKPEFLLYTKRLDGNWRLVGTMFYGGPGSGPAPNYFGPLDAWHLHENLCFTALGVRAVAGRQACSGVFVPQTNWQLHVWLTDDAEGVFAHDYKKIAPGAFPGATRRADQEFAVRAQ